LVKIILAITVYVQPASVFNRTCPWFYDQMSAFEEVGCIM